MDSLEERLGARGYIDFSTHYARTRSARHEVFLEHIEKGWHEALGTNGAPWYFNMPADKAQEFYNSIRESNTTDPSTWYAVAILATGGVLVGLAGATAIAAPAASMIFQYAGSATIPLVFASPFLSKRFHIHDERGFLTRINAFCYYTSGNEAQEYALGTKNPDLGPELDTTD
ncbi:TPA: hypothetical protein HA251_06520 [Candidatus Woesearchaeota archaeon]|nr:hypothetical protein [Candidatus Woesearchaeota archaeon]